MELKPLAPLAAALLLAIANMSIVEYLATPFKKKFTEVDFWWLLFVALGTGSVIGWFANIDLFSDLIPTMEPLAGKILTSVLIGGGASLIHNVFNGKAADTVVKLYKTEK
jgi:hypothetical protein